MTIDTGLLVQRVVYAGLDAVRSVLALDLCACVHVADGFGPQLYLRSPDLSSLDATKAFQLFSALRDLLDDPLPPTGQITVGGFTALARVTAGERSRNLFVAGRTDGALDALDDEVFAGLCDAMGAAANALEEAAGDAAAPGPLRVSVETTAGMARAEVWVPGASAAQPGRCEAHSPTRAVAQATLAAVDPTLKLGDAADDEIDRERAVLVLVRDAGGRAAVGSALSGDDVLRATALAALDAAHRLR